MDCGSSLAVMPGSRLDSEKLEDDCQGFKCSHGLLFCPTPHAGVGH